MATIIANSYAIPQQQFYVRHVHVSCFTVKWKNKMGIGKTKFGGGADTSTVFLVKYFTHAKKEIKHMGMG